MKRARKLARDTDVVAFLLSLPPEDRRRGIELLGEEERDALDRAWEEWAHAGQLAPPKAADGADWTTWVIKAGRGFGKTLAGAQWLTARIAEGEPLRIALVGATLDDARRVMVEGVSGLLTVAAPWLDDWQPSLRRLKFRTGAEAALFSGASPRFLRGPEHHYAWCDELAKWARPQECWDMLQMGLRLGAHPRAIVTTTPRSGSVLGAIMAAPGTVVTGGPTRANPHLSAGWRQRIEQAYAGTRLGRQELDGEYLPDAAGALWTVELIERCRVLRDAASTSSAAPQDDPSRRRLPAPPQDDPSRRRLPAPPQDERGLFLSACPEEGLRSSQSERLEGLSRRVIAVDPPTGDGTCGIVACAREGEGAQAIAHVLADHSVAARSPEGWARAVAAAAAALGTNEVVAEANQGGHMVKAVLTAADPGLRVRLVHARAGKAHRAEPVAHLFEAGRARLHGRMPELEAQLLGLIAGGGYEGPGDSPDRADAMVWGVSEVMKERGARVRGM